MILKWRKHTIMAYHTVYYFLLKAGEVVQCNECHKDIVGNEGGVPTHNKMYIIVPHCRDDKAVDFILCEACRKQA